ncbi:hypothetical protein COUCH_11575 [Couchioplanes caeruleus]|uniref:hypothetical protein n=1 Tax=Couchioplanes caeruleus TaxID=56438 RepID=UPI0020BFDADF|nr:hypothetical protein [Couchioplanes caeruleus]UQU66861.1 hypothetical protein COUCH_11575 [Couchioplanes caeruleus]
MTFWFDVSSPTMLTGVDQQLFRRQAKVDWASYGRMIEASNHVSPRVSRCFAGSAWLRRRFPARSHVTLFFVLSDDTSVSVTYLTTISTPDDDDSPQGIYWVLNLPTAWLAEPGDGLLGLRLFEAVLDALRVIGEHYGIGMPAAAGSGADRGDVWDPFGPPPRPSYADINTALERLTASLPPEQLLLVAKEPVTATVARQCRIVREALGTVINELTLTGPNTKGTAWTIQTTS